MGLNIARIGEPRPLRYIGDNPGRTDYTVTTTTLPTGPRGDSWLAIFNEQLTGPLLAVHDRADTVTVTCDPQEYPNWLWLVDMAIMRANEKESNPSKRPPE